MLNLILAQLLFCSFTLSGPGLSVPPSFSRSQPLETVQLKRPLDAGLDIPIDTGLITAFAATTDQQGRIFVAISSPDSLISIFFSNDQGSTWQKGFTLWLGAPLTRIELLSGNGDSSYLFVFYSVPDNSGDLYLLRIAPDFSRWLLVPIATGPDTIDNFTVTIDRGPSCYLYCLYVNEQRQGRNGAFTRSLDLGLTWELAQDFYNCLDPCLSFGAGSVLHCIWRYALNGREIHYTQNRHYGAPARWDWLRVISATGEKCITPVVAQAETSPPWRAPVWAIWTVARRDTENLDLVFSYSTDGGNSFSPPENLGEMFIDEWWPSIIASAWSANLVYNCGGRGTNQPTVVYWRYSRPWAPQVWSSPLRMNDLRANAIFEPARPRVVLPGVLFSYYRRESAWGVYFDQPFTSPEPIHPAPISAVTPVKSEYRQPVFDASGRRVSAPKPGPGVYFIYEKNRQKKILLIK
ncbi:MAG: hypothetical protein ACUVUR_04880 [bacterium]